jgi:hypothetical protein
MTQPAPVQTAHSEAVLPHLAIALLESSSGSLWGFIKARAVLGLERYGTALETHNGRCATKDTLDELLDALFYHVQERLEDGEPVVDDDFRALVMVAENTLARLLTKEAQV